MSPQLETARIGWNEDRERVTEFLFGVDPADARERAQVAAQVNQQIVNLTAVGAGRINAGSVNNIALAMAAAIYADERDRIMGGMQTCLRPSMRPDGTLDEVQFTLNPDGAALNVVNLPPEPPPLDFWAFLPEGDRKVLGKMVQLKK